jgi:glycosyltransferase involved in cell wall biosynthesis
MDKKDPLVSVIMPAYNAEKFIGEAIESILNQTFKDFEFIILDDCSTDKTWEIIKGYAKKDKRIVAVKNEKNLKISATLNKGILLARGKYISRMDADDWSYPQRFEKQINYLEGNSAVVLLGSFIEVADSTMKVLNLRRYPLDDISIRSTLLKYSTFAHPSVIYRREEAVKCGMYNIHLYDSEDYDFYFRIGNFGKFANCPEILLKLRTHKESVTQKKIQRQSMLTLYIKLKAVFEYGYQMNLGDKIFFYIHTFGFFFVPAKIRFRLFNFIRSFNK